MQALAKARIATIKDLGTCNMIRPQAVEKDMID
jgi:hypothetical protein